MQIDTSATLFQCYQFRWTFTFGFLFAYTREFPVCPYSWFCSKYTSRILVQAELRLDISWFASTKKLDDKFSSCYLLFTRPSWSFNLFVAARRVQWRTLPLSFLMFTSALVVIHFTFSPSEGLFQRYLYIWWYVLCCHLHLLTWVTCVRLSDMTIEKPEFSLVYVEVLNMCRNASTNVHNILLLFCVLSISINLVPNTNYLDIINARKRSYS